MESVQTLISVLTSGGYEWVDAYTGRTSAPACSSWWALMEGGKCSESRLTLGKRPAFLWKTENLETEAL